MPLSRAPRVAGQVVQTSRRPHVALYLADTAALVAGHSWLRELVEGLPEVRFRAQLPSTAAAVPAAFLVGFPSNFSLEAGVPGRGEGRRLSAAQRTTAEDALASLITALCLPDVGAFELSLEALSSLSEDGALSSVLLSGSAAQRVLEAWREVAQPAVRPRLPAPSVADALAIAKWLCGALRGFERPLPQANMGHALGSGEPGLLALHALWRRGTPFVLTEPYVGLRRRYLEFRRRHTPLGLKTLQLRFERLLCRAVYRHASVIVAGSERVRHWQEHLGAPPQRITVMSSGLQVPSSLLDTPAPEPAEAAVVWCGEVQPDQDLETLLRAFDLVRRQRPEAQLRLFTAEPGQASELERCRALVVSLRLERQVTFEPAPPSWSDAYRQGQVVVFSALDEEVPPGLLEAMALGRPIISPRLGAVPEVLGEAGVLITPRDLLALASNMLRLLGDPPLRRRLSGAARARAELFSAETWRQTYRQIYDKLLSDGPFGRSVPFAADEFDFGDDPTLESPGPSAGGRQ